MTFFKKTSFSSETTMLFEIQWVEVGNKNRSENRAQDGMYLGMDLSNILVNFWEPSWNPKRTPDRSEKGNLEELIFK